MKPKPATRHRRAPTVPRNGRCPGIAIPIGKMEFLCASYTARHYAPSVSGLSLRSRGLTQVARQAVRSMKGNRHKWHDP